MSVSMANMNKIQVSKKAVIAAFVRHVSGGVNVDQHAHAGHKQQQSKTADRAGISVDVECSRGSVALHKIQVAVAAAQPCINDFLERMSRPCAKCVYSTTVKQSEYERNHYPPTQTALTVAFCSRFPKKNIITAPKAGRAGSGKCGLRTVVSRRSLVVRCSRSLFA